MTLITMQPTSAQQRYSDLLVNTFRNTSLMNNNTLGSYQNSLVILTQVVDALRQLFLQSSRANTSVATLVASSDTVTVLLSLIKMQNLSVSSQNVSGFSFLPPYVLPSGKGSVSVAAPQTNSSISQVLITLISIAENLAAAAREQATANSKTLPGRIVSDVVSVTISAVAGNGSVGHAVLPIFVANLSASSGVSDFSVIRIFTHNCSVGVEESVSFLCPGSYVRYNLTCTGKTALNVRQQCPVAQQVCNVLNLRTLSVLSTDYCTASQSSSGFVVCSCGLGNTSESSKATIVAGGSVNVAVMTQYIAGDLGSIGGPDGLSAGAFAAQSSSIFITFGCLWGFGLVLMVYHYTHKVGSVTKKLGKKDLTGKPGNSNHQFLSVVPYPDEHPQESNDTSRVQEVMWVYLASVLPVSYQLGEWWERLWRLLCLHHTYCRAASYLYSEIVCDSSTHSMSGSLATSHRRKKAMMDIAQIMTLVMVSFLVLAVLYDFQYPADDGTCAENSDKTSCLARKSLLDKTVTYCEWHASPSSRRNILLESRFGVLLQKTALEDEESTTQCRFNGSESSILIVVMSVVIASIVSIPTEIILNMLFARVGARSTKQVRVQVQASQASTALAGAVPSTNDVGLSGGRNRRRGVGMISDGSNERRGEFPASSSSTSSNCTTEQLSVIKSRVLPLQLYTLRAHLMDLWCQHGFVIGAAKQSHHPGISGSLSGGQSSRIFTGDVEFGVQLLQRYFGELLASRHVFAERIYQKLVVDTFEENVGAVSDVTKYLCVFGVVCINFGAFFYVALKGTQRGQSWQRAFLFACAIEWMTDVFFAAILEIWILHVLLPATALSEVMQIRDDVQRTMVEYLALQEYERNQIAMHLSTTDDPSFAKDSFGMVFERPWLFESGFVYFAMQQSSSSGPNDSSQTLHTAQTNWAQRIVCLAIETIPGDVLGFLVSVTASLFQGVLLYVVFSLSTVGVEISALSDVLQVVFFLVLIATALFVARRSLHHPASPASSAGGPPTSKMASGSPWMVASSQEDVWRTEPRREVVPVSNTLIAPAAVPARSSAMRPSSSSSSSSDLSSWSLLSSTQSPSHTVQIAPSKAISSCPSSPSLQSESFESLSTSPAASFIDMRQLDP